MPRKSQIDRRERPRIPKSPQANRYAERYAELLQRKDPEMLKRTPSVKNTLSTDSNTYHPPSLTTSVSAVQRDDHDTELVAPSFIRDTSEVKVVYHPPANLENAGKTDQDLEQDRYRAALEASFTPQGVQNFSRKMDNRIIQVLSSETQMTESTMGNYTEDTAEGISSTFTYGTSYTNASSTYRFSQTQ